MGSEKGKKFKEGDTERDGVPGRTVMSPYDPLRPGEVQEVTLAEIASFSANGTKIGVGPLRAGNSVIPRGRTPDTIYFFTYKGRLFRRIGTDVAPLEEGDMFSNGLFFITLSSEGLHVRSGERNRTNFPLNELVANDLELAEAALAQEGQNHDALVGFMGVPPPLPESLSGVRTLSPSAPGPQPLAAARTFSTELGDRDDTSAQAIGLRGRFKVVDACSTTLDVNVPMTLPIELQSTDVVAVRIQSLANKEAACTVFIRGGEVHVVDNEGRVRTSLNATHAFDGIPGQYQIEFVQAEGMPTLRLIAQDEAGLLVDVRKVQFRSQATLLDAPTLAERDDVPVSVRAPRLAPRPEGLSDLRLNTRNQVLRNTAMAVGFTIVAAMGAAVATQVKGCMEAHATADVQPVPFPMSND